MSAACARKSFAALRAGEVRFPGTIPGGELGDD